MGIKAYPDKESIHVGDTLWLEVNEPVTLKDMQTGRMIDYSGASNLGTLVGTIELLGKSLSRDAANDFIYLLKAGTDLKHPNTSLFREYSFNEVNSEFSFKLSIIPTKKGIYRISVSDASNVYRKNDKCTKANFRINFKDTNQHLHYNEENYGVVVPLPNNGYCFKVE